MDEKAKKSLIEAKVEGKENALIESYILAGPTATKVAMGVGDTEWQVVFDYLVFEYNLLFRTVANSPEFFKDEYVKYGLSHIREILDVNDAKYDPMVEVIFDYIAIANDGLYYHVLENRDEYSDAFKKQGSASLRDSLGIKKAKYEEHWEMVLDVLLKAFSDNVFNENHYDHSLKAFALLMNGMREHRPLIKHELYELK